MKSRLLPSFCVLAFGLSLVSGPVLAHHGFAGRYDEEHPYTVQGTVLEFQFINPHSAIIFEAKDQGGAMQRWHAELGGANALHRADGWTKDTLKVGDKITIVGPRNKNGSNDMNLSHESKISLTDTGKEIHNSFRGQQQGQ
jgi:Family of unknown function (DUF6152)